MRNRLEQKKYVLREKYGKLKRLRPNTLQLAEAKR